MPEELAFDHAGRKGGAVHLHEELVLPPTQIVDRADDQLLPGARLAGDQHGGIGLRDFPHGCEDTEDRRGLADDVAKRRFRPNLLLKVDVLLLQASLEGGDLLVSEQILEGERHLLGD